MIQRRHIATAAAAALTLAVAGQASAHARLVSSNPAANATVAAPATIALRFNEKLEKAFSGLDLTSGGAKTPLKVNLAADRVTLTAVPAKPLAPGVYKVEWHAVSADGHRMTGDYDFTVK